MQIGNLKQQYAIENAIFSHFWSALVDSQNSLRLPPIRCDHGNLWLPFGFHGSKQNVICDYCGNICAGLSPTPKKFYDRIWKNLSCHSMTPDIIYCFFWGFHDTCLVIHCRCNCHQKRLPAISSCMRVGNGLIYNEMVTKVTTSIHLYFSVFTPKTLPESLKLPTSGEEDQVSESIGKLFP